MATEIVDAPERRRYEALVEGELAGFAEYILTDQLIVLPHTEVDRAYEGLGVGGALARFALDDARARGLAVLPICPFIKGWIGTHPDYQDLLYHPAASDVAD